MAWLDGIGETSRVPRVGQGDEGVLAPSGLVDRDRHSTPPGAAQWSRPPSTAPAEMSRGALAPVTERTVIPGSDRPTVECPPVAEEMSRTLIGKPPAESAPMLDVSAS